MLRPLLKSLKLITHEGFQQTFDCSMILKSALSMYNPDIVSDDLDTLVAILSLTTPELSRQVFDTISHSVDQYVVN